MERVNVLSGVNADPVHVAIECKACGLKSDGASSSDVATATKSDEIQLCSVTLEHCLSYLSSSDPLWLPYVLKSKTIPAPPFSNKRMCAMQRNVVRNPAAAEGDRHWTRNGYGSLIIETNPRGANPFPDGASRCWTASNCWDGRCQTIDLCGDRLQLDPNFLDSRPGLELSFYMAACVEQGVVMRGSVTLLDEEMQQVSEYDFGHSLSASVNWHYVVKNVGGSDGLPRGVRHVILSWEGIDTRAWAGHYGAKITCIALRLRPPGYELQPDILNLSNLTYSCACI